MRSSCQRSYCALHFGAEFSSPFSQKQNQSLATLHYESAPALATRHCPWIILGRRERLERGTPGFLVSLCPVSSFVGAVLSRTKLLRNIGVVLAKGLLPAKGLYPAKTPHSSTLAVNVLSGSQSGAPGSFSAFVCGLPFAVPAVQSAKIPANKSQGERFLCPPSCLPSSERNSAEAILLDTARTARNVPLL